MHTTLRSGAILTAAATLALVAGCGSSPDTSPAADGGASSSPTASYDTSAMQRSATWISGQLTNGVLHDPKYNFDDYGTSADVALALAAIGGHDSTVDSVASTVTQHQQEYVSPGFGTLTSAGAVAKSVVLDQATNTDPGDLVSTLQGLVTSTGRVADKLDPKAKKATDYANTIVQALTVQALDGAHASDATKAAAYLLDQQCSAGFFRLYFPTDGKGAQSCDADPKSAPDVDTTAYVVVALRQVSDLPGVASARAKAASWLAGAQGADGSFKASQPPVPNADSTGLAGWALGIGGKTEAAGRAATWIAAHMVRCGKDAGAIGYDDTALKTGVTKATAGQFRLATAQAVPALQWLPKGAGATESGSC
jgi:hypothetical protein